VQIQGIALTDTGSKRKVNEDDYGYFSDIGLFLVADGMGGHVAGKTASRLAVTKIREFFDQCRKTGNIPLPQENDLDTPVWLIKKAVEYASRSIYEAGIADIQLKGMGSTLVSLFLTNDAAYIAHVGDSRLYRLREGGFSQLTTDHSLVNKLLQKGEITPEEARHYPHRNVITRALGTSMVKVDIQKQPLKDGDSFLLCTDGLHGLVAEDELKTAMSAPSEDLETAGQNLLTKANQNGGTDNITMILLRVSIS
jgi:serine/threonine protein phosphatase PrpC